MTGSAPRACGVCGHKALAPHRAPAAELAPDLDLRPGEPARSTLAQWMLACRHCGAAAPDLAALAPGDRTVIDGEDYQALRGTGSRFRRYAAICRAKGQAREAGDAMLQAAWMADDAGEEANARAWRLDAAALWTDSLDEETALRRIDALRRAGDFPAAAAEAAALAGRIHDESSVRILAFQNARIAAADAGVYRISSALRPPAHSPHVAHGRRPSQKGLLARLFGR